LRNIILRRITEANDLNQDAKLRAIKQYLFAKISALIHRGWAQVLIGRSVSGVDRSNMSLGNNNVLDGDSVVEMMDIDNQLHYFNRQ
jgi:hypothetical protein